MTATDPPVATVHPSLAMYLHGHRFAPTAGFLHDGIPIPCAGVEVRADALAATMFAAAFWALHRDGAIGIELEMKKRLRLVTTTRVVARLQDHTPRPGLEGAIVDTLDDGSEQAYVRDVVRDWFGDDVESPGHHVVRVEHEAAVDLGLIDRREVDAGRGRVMSWLAGATDMEEQPRCEAIAAVDVDRLATDWEAFQTEQPDLARRLVDTCADAIGSRAEIEHDD
jgi:hypothetical protein